MITFYFHSSDDTTHHGAEGDANGPGRVLFDAAQISLPILPTRVHTVRADGWHLHVLERLMRSVPGNAHTYHRWPTVSDGTRADYRIPVTFTGEPVRFIIDNLSVFGALEGHGQ
jgi:hypothetical protein